MIYVGQQEIKRKPATFLLPNRHRITQHLNEDLRFHISLLFPFSLLRICLIIIYITAQKLVTDRKGRRERNESEDILTICSCFTRFSLASR